MERQHIMFETFKERYVDLEKKMTKKDIVMLSGKVE